MIAYLMNKGIAIISFCFEKIFMVIFSNSFNINKSLFWNCNYYLSLMPQINLKVK